MTAQNLYSGQHTTTEMFQPRNQQTRLLVVDDDDVDRERIKRFITKIKIPLLVIFAQNGTEAIQKISQCKVDLILLDYQLGDMTGTDVLTVIKDQQNLIVPTIMVTGMGDEKTAIEAMRLGVFDYLPKKHLTAESLLTALASALRSVDLKEQLQKSQDNLRHMSLYDSLTGLPNRNLFFDRLNQAILTGERNQTTFSILMIDLNLFKEVNDSLGHQAGDEVLTVIGERLHTIVRKSDTLARLGGDEFSYILNNLSAVEDTTLLAEKIIDVISEPIIINDRVAQIGASIGIAHYPDHGQDPTTLLSNADCAMYSAKRSHRKYEIYSVGDDYSGNKKVPVSQYLHKSIRDKELFLEYQPKVDLNTNEIKGAEILVRWNSPEFGLVMPSEFITVAERSSLIEELTHHTIDLAFSQWASWRDDNTNIPLAVNISARMLDDRNLPQRISNKLDEYKVPPSDITLEITETILASSGHTAHLILSELSEMGFHLSIDDFGTGFTSFRSIRSIAISELKIDRLYISEIHMGKRDLAIVRSMVSLAQSLGVRTVAEGIENQDQWDTLQNIGCNYGQGYGIAQPMTADTLMNWIATS